MKPLHDRILDALDKGPVKLGLTPIELVKLTLHLAECVGENGHKPRQTRKMTPLTHFGYKLSRMMGGLREPLPVSEETLDQLGAEVGLRESGSSRAALWHRTEVRQGPGLVLLPQNEVLNYWWDRDIRTVSSLALHSGHSRSVCREWMMGRE